MYEQPSFDSQNFDGTPNDNKKVKIAILISAVVLVLAITTLFLVLYFGKKDKSSDDNKGGEQTEEISENGESLEASDDVSSESFDDASAENSSDISEESAEESSEDISEESSEEPDHVFVKNNMGYTYLYYGVGYNQFNGTQTLASSYAESLNKLSSMVDFPVYSMIAPTSVEFVEIPRDIRQEDDFFNSSQKIFISNANNSISATPIDIYTPISEKAKEEYLYLRTDKNWTADAAYYAYVQFCNTTGNIAAAKTSYEAGKYEGYLGNFYYATYSEKLKANADTVNFYKISDVFPCVVTMYSDGLAYKDRALIYSQLSNPTSYAYYAFLGDRGDTFTITSQNAASDKSILVVGDSSAFAFVPYLVANYKNVYFVNAEAYDGTISDYLVNKTVDEAVVLSYATSAATPSYISRLSNLFGAPVTQ